MQFKQFQEQVLTRLDEYLIELKAQSDKSDRQTALAAANPEAGIQVADFTAKTWETMKEADRLPEARAKVPFSPRRDGVGRPVPNVCFKVPTGGGKTLLAAAAIARVHARWAERRTGVVLWICPNEAIYSQTRRALKDREHPYRQMLDQASAGRTRILEKDDPLHRADCDAHLTVLLMMLQSANRETRESLRLFRDRGNVNGFFPTADDRDAHAALLQAIPNLDTYGDLELGWHQVKDSLGNALRLLRPVVVLDEGHKGYSRLAMDTIYGFNPNFVLELSATPADRLKDSPPTYSNWLVDVRGTDLDREDMIKSPIEVSVQPGNDWRATLRVALERLETLQRDADTLFASQGRYLRPIALVQVERTGKEQRDGRHVHADDVREHLLTLGLREDQIAIKSAEQNDLAVQDRELLDSGNPVRFIITKQALQEGWDCPFAYVLCSLAKVTAAGAMTQLVGRILRQPETRKTGIAALDACYVICQHASSADVVKAIKRGLEQDGLGDLASQIRDTTPGSATGPRTVHRRPSFAKLQVFLPQVLWTEGSVRELDYECDLLSQFDPDGIDLSVLVDRLRSSNDASRRLDFRLRYDSHEVVAVEARETTEAPVVFDRVFACRALSDLIPNAWQAWDIVDRLIAALRDVGVDPYRLGAASTFVIDELRNHLNNELDTQAEAAFRRELAAGRIQFRLRTDGRNYRLDESVETSLPMGAAQLTRDADGEPIAKSVFAPVYREDFDGLERAFAGYVDSEHATRWWFRNVARRQYGLQGWRRHKVYPDFVVAIAHGDGSERRYVWETKGRHLDNPDSHYKRALMQALSNAFSLEHCSVSGAVEIELEPGLDLRADLLLEQDWEAEVRRAYFAAQPPP
jgi:type III restriction enzyme